MQIQRLKFNKNFNFIHFQLHVNNYMFSLSLLKETSIGVDRE